MKYDMDFLPFDLSKVEDQKAVTELKKDLLVYVSQIGWRQLAISQYAFTREVLKEDYPEESEAYQEKIDQLTAEQNRMIESARTRIKMFAHRHLRHTGWNTQLDD